jgi:aminoglycoside phosphotransferase (APT) family kinase protein
VVSLVDQLLARRPRSCERVVEGGGARQVFVVALPAGDQVVVRIDGGGGPTLAAEAWASERARRAGVPVPRVLVVAGDLTVGDRRVSCSIQEHLDAPSLELLRRPGPVGGERLERIVERAGEVLARLHSLENTGYGRLDPNGVGRWGTAQEWLRSATVDRLGSFPLGLSTNEADRLVEQLAVAAEVLAGPPRLLHYDFAPKHLLVGPRGEVVGLIDFEDASSGDPALDLAKWSYRFDSALPLRWLIRGYVGAGGVLGDDFERRLGLAVVVRLVHTIEYFSVERPSERWAAAARRALSLHLA